MQADEHVLTNISNLFLQEIKTMELASDWEPKNNKEVRTFEKKIDKRVVAKAVTLLKIPFEKVFKFFEDAGSITLINKDHMEKFQVLQSYKDFKVVHLLMNLSGPAHDREVCAVHTVKREGEGKAYVGLKSCDYPLQQEKESKAKWATVHLAGFVIDRVDELTTNLTYISDIDLNGHIPDVIQNGMTNKRV